MEFVKIFGKYMNSRYIKALFGGGEAITMD